ncbi:MAG: single-stranded-DNA-specific exonuclease RecJ [Melioribacteraceae bacterium]|nr:single-stranded-DNA-specific exonuclease RecJ [Melioribacteraceae bacterium]MCF8264175.1 single-stranded-DNA-specific exonuclease RecJ [Melioribacteraceae bacterium]MCF8412644.1 single-stranded-DNA-specific exonuclease RecJ [Melioribacteraceae bacterium]MCF8430511.1 single-stranded-DNA-specific exonuclease RecJ [Melioribacteraceae bacterium]
MQQKRWKFRESSERSSVLALADSLNISTVLSELLVRRGITNFFEAKTYFRPDIESLYDPFLMNGMEDAAKRVIKAITGNEKITVYGDYDVDGTCSAALMFLFIKELGGNVDVYIPNRLTDGYGLSNFGIDNIRERNTSLIIAVDCGITAVNEVEYAKQFGIDLIICDHHQPKEEIPDAVAVLDPLKPGCDYPFKYLSGAGVAFKLARAVSDLFGKKDMVLKYLDLVALAAAADIVPLMDENRILVRAGIDSINSNPRPGIKALITSARMQPGDLSAGQIVFTIAPRINAVGRLGDANRAVDLFVTEDENEAIRLAQVLESENYERRKIDEVTFAHAVKMVDDYVDFENDIAIVLHSDDWHAGVIGIVASRMVEKFHRPSIMLSTIDGVAKGSARSIPGVNIYQAIENCEDLLLQFGGHEAAAGLAIEIENIPEFRKRFNLALKQTLTEDDILPEIKVDMKISLSEITPKFLRILDQFAPFGPLNMRPVFVAEDVSLISQPRIVGSNHFLASVRQNGNDKVFDTIGFNLGGFVNLIDKEQNLLDIVFTIEKLNKDGRTYPQLRLKDIHIKEIAR